MNLATPCDVVVGEYGTIKTLTICARLVIFVIFALTFYVLITARIVSLRLESFWVFVSGTQTVW